MAVVVAQLAEWSLLIPEIRCSNRDIGKYLYGTFLTVKCTEMKRRKRNIDREWPIFKYSKNLNASLTNI